MKNPINTLLFFCLMAMMSCTALLKTAGESAFDYAEDKGLFEPKVFEVKAAALATPLATADSLFSVAVSPTAEGYKIAVKLSRSPLQAIADAYLVKLAQKLDRKRKKIDGY